jgi:hypothetical protein
MAVLEIRLPRLLQEKKLSVVRPTKMDTTISIATIGLPLI